MPIPRPNKDESQSDFMHRCMGNSVMNREFSESKQRVAVCMQSWRDKDKKEGKSSLIPDDEELNKFIRDFIERHPEYKKYVEEEINDG